jgi:hypothetical protein
MVHIEMQVSHQEPNSEQEITDTEFKNTTH